MTTLDLTLAQVAVSTDITRNLRRIIDVIEGLAPDAWAVFPEGLIGGYTPGRPFDPRRLAGGTRERERLAAVVEAVAAQTQAQSAHALVGRIVDDADGSLWRNTAAIFAPDGGQFAYVKAHLAADERALFAPGDVLPVFTAGDVTYGVQMGRDVLFPEQWRDLRSRGAVVIFHLNNAIRAEQGVWRHLVIARAVENGCYVVSSNNAEPPGRMSSLVVAPDGSILAEIPAQAEGVERVTLDLDAVNDDLLRQLRDDLA